MVLLLAIFWKGTLATTTKDSETQGVSSYNRSPNDGIPYTTCWTLVTH